MYRTYQMARVLKVASRIHHQPRQWTRPRLADTVGVDKGTIQRDINLLREMGIQIVARGKQGYEMNSDFFLPALNLDFEETLALITAASVYFAPRIALLIREVRWHPTQKLHTMPDGKLIFEVAVAGLREISWCVMTWGDEAEVLEPKELRERVTATARKMVEVYQEN